MADGERGTPAGEVGTSPKPCGFSFRLDRQFIGRSQKRVLPVVGKELPTAGEAILAAFDDAAQQALAYFLEQYHNLHCQAPCHKTWKIDAPTRPLPPDAGIADQILAEVGKAISQAVLEKTGGLGNDEPHVSIDGSLIRCSIKVHLNIVLSCATELTEDKADPKGDQFNGGRKYYEAVAEYLSKLP